MKNECLPLVPADCVKESAIFCWTLRFFCALACLFYISYILCEFITTHKKIPLIYCFSVEEIPVAGRVFVFFFVCCIPWHCCRRCWFWSLCEPHIFYILFFIPNFLISKHQPDQKEHWSTHTCYHNKTIGRIHTWNDHDAWANWLIRLLWNQMCCSNWANFWSKQPSFLFTIMHNTKIACFRQKKNTKSFLMKNDKQMR